MKYLRYAISLLTLVLSSCANVPAATTSVNSTQEASVKNPIKFVGQDEELLREFIRQWVIPWYTGRTPQDVTFYIGDTPVDIRYELPALEDSRVIGSIKGNEPEEWVDYLLILDSSRTSESVHEFYAQSLIDKGWHEAPANQGNGFFHSDTYKGYCYGENEAFLSVETRSLTAGKTTIGLRLDINPQPQFCDLDPNSEASYLNGIPALRLPKGMTDHEGGLGQTSARSAQMSINLIGDLPAADVVDSYNEQLLAAGWKLQGSGVGEGAAWSNWTFQDEQGSDWIGALMVVEASSQSNILYAFVTIEKTK
jgi:hypothetical protein